MFLNFTLCTDLQPNNIYPNYILSSTLISLNIYFESYQEFLKKNFHFQMSIILARYSDFLIVASYVFWHS